MPVNPSPRKIFVGGIGGSEGFQPTLSRRGACPSGASGGASTDRADSFTFFAASNTTRFRTPRGATVLRLRELTMLLLAPMPPAPSMMSGTSHTSTSRPFHREEPVMAVSGSSASSQSPEVR